MALLEIIPAHFSFRRAIALYMQRRALRALPDERLRDIGRSRSEVEREANRPVWDAPEHWYSS